MDYLTVALILIVVGVVLLAAEVLLPTGGILVVGALLFFAAGVGTILYYGDTLEEPDLSVPGHPDVFVIGDLASVTQTDGKPVPGVAPAAKQMGRYVAATLKARWQGKQPRPFRYRDDGSLATIGRMAAVAQFGRLKLSGLLAWWVWLIAHIAFLIGFRNRLVVMLDWAWAYWTYQRHARIVTGTDETATLPRDA